MHFCGIVSELFKFNGQQRESLADIVVKLSGDPGAFLFLSFDQLSGHSRHRLVRELAISNVNARTYVANKRAICMKPWHADVENPAIQPIVSSQPAFLPDRLPLIEPATISVMTLKVVVGMNDSGQSVLKIGL